MYIYLGTYYHTEYKGKLCIVDNNGEYITLEKKIGKTEDLSSREIALNRTKSPLGYTMIRAWETGSNTDNIEKAIHSLLGNNRSNGEWFNDDEETLEQRLENFMTHLGYREVSLSSENLEVASNIKRNSSSQWDNEKNLIGMSFKARGVTIKCIDLSNWLCETTGGIHPTANRAFCDGAKHLQVQPAINVWEMKEVQTGKSLREIHDNI